MAAKTRAKETIGTASKLVIVESPAKAKTIEGYLGSDYKVVSCYGHIRDLPKKNNAIDIENGFKPTYEVSQDKKEVIKELKRLAKDASLVYLASDDDREGEAISWHLQESLKLKTEDTRRIVFREITKNAITQAIENPRQIDQNLVNAQQARRILDRLVGFELSPLLWKKIKAGLSAGRVQSVAVRMVVEREREIERFQAESSFRVQALLEVEAGKQLKAELPKRYARREEAQAFLNACLQAHFSVARLQVKEGRRKPSAPFTTSTLQQEASRKLGFSVARTMTLAQRLYEAGKITYMRTDSLNLSEDALQSAAQVIRGNYGEAYLEPRRFKTKSESAQEAHEAIRPTDFAVSQAGSDSGEQALYELIWKRAVASQMSEARIEKTTATIAISGMDETLTATGEVIRFDGFLKVYLEGHDDDDREEAKMLPPLNVGQQLPLMYMTARETFSKPPARYTEASLVKHMEELGIGRPSTYAPTISTIQKRGYVEKESRDGKPRQYWELKLENQQISQEQKTEIYGTEKGKLFPTSLAKIVTDFLVEYFANVVDYHFTAQVEEEFDSISQGKKAWNEMIADFYFHDFHPKVEKTKDVDRAEVAGSRELGQDPASGKKVVARLGRFGPIVQIGSADDEEKPRFAPLNKDQFIDTITLEQALELFKLPRTLGEYEGQEVVISKGPFGPYVRHEGKFTSIPKEEDPLQLSLERAIELIEAKRKADAEKFIRSFDENPEVQILKGRWGPYIKFGKKNVKVPKDTDPMDLSFETVMTLIEQAPDKKRGTKTAAKSTAKTTAKAAAKSTGKTAAKSTSKSTAKSASKTTAKSTTKKQSTAKKTSKAGSTASKTKSAKTTGTRASKAKKDDTAP
ncbi:MAG: type I DNA topoisomerase [Candidatus Sericytochromatia bacterium]|nr:type I DNA topoisomerase [Candidatus Sericytochromatia bacterium]